MITINYFSKFGNYKTKSTAHSFHFTVGHACLSFYFPDVLSQAAVAIRFATCRIIRNPPINGSLPVIVHKRSRSFHQVRSDQNLNTATPYAGRSYANEYGLPSHSTLHCLVYLRLKLSASAKLCIITVQNQACTVYASVHRHGNPVLLPA